MIDLETMGIRPSSAIVSIGAVAFDELEIKASFYTAISLTSSTSLGLTTDQSTVNWWMKQSPEARAAWQTEDAPNLSDALAKFCAWVREQGLPSQIKPWGNGSDFDLVLLNSSFGALGASAPWKFYNHRCFRTVKNLLQTPEPVRQGVHHNALDDAIHQARHLQCICRAHGLRI